VALIKDKHQTLFENLTTTLLTDMGHTVILHRLNSDTDCTWCDLDAASRKSSGIPSTGKVWSTHINYQGNNLRCPECYGRGYVPAWSDTTLTKTVVEDMSGMQFVKGKAAYYPTGTKKVTGLLSDVISGTHNHVEEAKTIEIGGDDYTLVSFEKVGIKENFLFFAIVERTDLIERET
jgi:hypothetical protein